MVWHGPRAEHLVPGPPSAGEEVIHRAALVGGHVSRDAMTGEPKYEALDEVWVPAREPLGVASPGRDAHDPDGAAPSLSDDRGVVVGDLGRHALRWQVGP